MKKFLTQQINFGYAIIVMLMLTIGVGMTSAAILPNDTPVNTISPLIHQGAGEQVIAGLRIGSCNGGACIGSFDVRGALNNIAFFDTLSSLTTPPLFLVTGNVGIVGKLFVGEGAGANLPLWTTTYNGSGGIGSGFTIPLQRVNVYGNARATNLTNNSAPAPVCVNPNGMLLLCGTINTPINGQCGPSNGGTFTTPPTTGLCNQGEASAVTTNPSTYTWTCNGVNGGTTASCQATRIVTNNGVCHDFGAGPFSSQPATGQNGCDSGTYGDQTDTQYLWKWGCNGSNGGANVNCTEPRTQTYTWQIGNWGVCTSSCSGTPAQGPKVDWNGNPLNWINGKVYRSDASGSAITDCGANPESADLVVGDHFDFDPVEFSGGACITYLQSYPSLGYEASIDSGIWNRISIVPGDVLDTEPGRVLAVNNDNPLYQQMGQCNGTTQQTCTAVQGCNWNPGTQTRTVVCKDQNGATVNDSFCTPPKPVTSQSC